MVQTLESSAQFPEDRNRAETVETVTRLIMLAEFKPPRPEVLSLN
jgi:hypothetical protein